MCACTRTVYNTLEVSDIRSTYLSIYLSITRLVWLSQHLAFYGAPWPNFWRYSPLALSRWARKAALEAMLSSAPGTSGGTHAIGRGVVQLPHGMWPLHVVQVNAWLAYADAEYASSCGGGQPSWKKCCSGMPNWLQRIRMAWNENIRNADEPRGILMPTTLLTNRRRAIRNWLIGEMRKLKVPPDLPLVLKYLPSPSMAEQPQEQPASEQRDTLLPPPPAVARPTPPAGALVLSGLSEQPGQSAQPPPVMARLLPPTTAADNAPQQVATEQLGASPQPLSLATAVTCSPCDDDAFDAVGRPEDSFDAQSHAPKLGVSTLLCDCDGERGVLASANSAIRPPPPDPKADAAAVCGVRAPLQQPALVELGLRSWEMEPGHLDPSIFEAMLAYAHAVPMDDLMVRRLGWGDYLHKYDTKHPSPDRRYMSTCHRHGRLSTYSQKGICDNEDYWTMNHLPVELHTGMTHTWERALPALRQTLPKTSIALKEPPNFIAIQIYKGERRVGEIHGTRDFINWHTDHKKTRPGSEPDMWEDSPILSVSSGSDQLFWTRRLLANGHKGAPRIATVLKHGSVWIWVPSDDLSHEHRVEFPSREDGWDETHTRVVIIFRWVKLVREYDPKTHRNKSGKATVKV